MDKRYNKKKKWRFFQMSKKAIIFDLDCTLHDRETSLYLFLESQYQNRFQGEAAFSFHQYYRDFVDLEKFGRVWKDLVYKEIVNKYQISYVTSEELLEDYVNCFRNHCVLFEGTEQMLAELTSSGYVLGIITNGKTNFQKGTIHALRIARYFKDIIISDEIGLKKPDKRIFGASLKNLNVCIGDAIYIGDHPIDDIEAAKNAGFRTIWKRNHHWGEASPDASFNDMRSLPSIIETMFI
jgi:putative hydrolase of the HAD superfamily